jgi:hypothetical protein
VTGFNSPEKGIRVSYPAAWQPGSGPDAGFVLWLRREGNPSTVSLEVPKLPPHVPGLIPLGSVVNGYVNDLKKQHADLKVESPVETKVAGANARRVRSTWAQDGAPVVEDAVLTVHADRVYIFRANAREDEAAVARDALETMLHSAAWQ